MRQGTFDIYIATYIPQPWLYIRKKETERVSSAFNPQIIKSRFRTFTPCHIDILIVVFLSRNRSDFLLPICYIMDSRWLSMAI